MWNTLYSGLHKNNKHVDLRIVDNKQFLKSQKLSEFIILCSQKYNKFRTETLHNCGIHTYLQQDFSIFFKTHQNTISDLFLKRATCRPSSKVSYVEYVYSDTV
jgi:hypothetical protein